MELKDVRQFGYAELYELEDISQNKFGRFVGFSNNSPNKVCYSNDINNIIGVTSNNFCCLSDIYKEWPYKYQYDDNGNLIYENKTIAIGTESYDDDLEISFIQTTKYDIKEKKINDKFEPLFNYVPRIYRDEWVPVTILGKCIVEDDGTCIPGHKCFLYEGDDPKLKGIVTLSLLNPNQHGWHVIKRISKNKIMIFLK